MAKNTTQNYKCTENFFFFAHQFSLVFVYLMCGPRQLFFFQCGPETPEGWTLLIMHYNKSTECVTWISGWETMDKHADTTLGVAGGLCYAGAKYVAKYSRLEQPAIASCSLY